MPVLDLIDAIKPGAIKYDLVNSGNTEEVAHVADIFTKFTCHGVIGQLSHQNMKALLFS